MSARAAFPIATSLATVLGASFAFGGITLRIPVSEDESVNSQQSDRNYSDNLVRGGLFAGADGGLSGISRFYLKFKLPSTITPDTLQSATLVGTHTDDFDIRDNGSFKINLVAADDWNEKSITWDNQPGPAFGTSEARFAINTVGVGQTGSWDLTPVVKSELKTDGVLSLMVSAENESIGRTNRNWEYFAEREFSTTSAFRLELNASKLSVGGGTGGGSTGGGVDGGPVVVPLPGALPAAMLTFGCIGAAKYIRRRRAESQAR